MLAMAYLSLTHSKEEYQVILRNMSGYIYHRTPETEYWDGFANQCVTIFDDFLQKKEVAGGDSAALDIVRCLNGDPALLHMANINDKGTTYFGSKLVILSSNQPDPISEAVTCIMPFAVAQTSTLSSLFNLSFAFLAIISVATASMRLCSLPLMPRLPSKIVLVFTCYSVIV